MHLETHATVAVVAYPNSGKSVTIAEFARTHPSTCLWFSIPPGATESDSWFVILCYRVAAFLALEEINPDRVFSALGQYVINRPCLLVIDNAQHCNDLKNLTPLRQLADASNRRFQIVLIGTNDPSFRDKTYRAGLFAWTCPGFTAADATRLYELLGGPLSEHQAHGLTVLSLMADGHAGLLRLAHSAIRRISSASERDAFISARRNGLGKDAEHLRIQLIEQFRSGLSDAEFAMCKRVSISLRPFYKRVAESIWSCDQNAESFADTWNRCVVTAFDATEDGRFSLPEIYQQGCREFCRHDETRQWHNACASEFERPVDGVIDVGDVINSIAHRVLGGEPSLALQKAAVFLATVRTKHRRLLCEFMISQFDLWLTSAAASNDATVDARIIWHAIRADVCRTIGWHKECASSMNSLQTVLATANGGLDEFTRTMGWGTVLVHASAQGNCELAMRASDHLRGEVLFRQGGSNRFREIFVLMAFAVAKKSPLQFLQSLLVDAGNATDRKARLWDAELNYDFWRAIGSTVYLSISSKGGPLPTELSAEFELGTDVVRRLLRDGEFDVAAILGANVVRILIDVKRDFLGAVALAKETTNRGGQTDERARNHLMIAFADALRCAGDLESADYKYREILSNWPIGCELDHAENLSMLAVTVARRGRFADGAKLMRKAASEFSELERRTAAARCHLEAAAMRCHDRNKAGAIRDLIAAKSFVRQTDATCPEWVTLGQIAMWVAGHTQIGSEINHLPTAGFTLSIDGPIPDSSEMKANGPTLMLAQACEMVGRLNRAASLFEAAIDTAEPAQLSITAALAVRSALAIGKIARAAQLAAVATGVPDLPEMPELATKAHGFRYRYLIDSVVFSAICDGSNRNHELELALELLADSTIPRSESVDVMRTSLEAILAADRDGDLDYLDAAFKSCEAAEAWTVARHLAWFWLFRAFWGKRIQTADFVQWLWRHCRLTVQVGRNDESCLYATQQQHRQLLNRVSKDFVEPPFPAVNRSLHDDSTTSIDAIAAAATICAEWCASNSNMANFVSELWSASRLDDGESLGPAINTFTPRLLGLILLPLANERIADLRESIRLISEVIERVVIASDTQRNAWKNNTRRLTALVDVLASGKETSIAFNALLEWRLEMPRKLPAAAAATFYVWLRHLIGGAEGDASVLPLVWKSIGSDYAASLAVDPTVPEYLRDRLRLCHTVALGHLAFERLIRAMSIVATQCDLAMPIRMDVRRSAHQEVSEAMRDFDAAIHRLREFSTEFSSVAGRATEYSSCCMEMAGLLELTGSHLRKEKIDDNRAGAFLKEALENYVQATLAAQKGGLADVDIALVIRPAVQGRFLARMIGENAIEHELDAFLAELPRTAAVIELIDAENKRSARASPLSQETTPHDQPTERSVAELQDELVNHVMVAGGLPEDRRPFVASDARKLVVIEQTQRVFCQHLQPLQNLVHTRSPSTAFAGPTSYAGHCSLLHHEMNIELEDIHTVIESFKKIYCENCPHRTPKK